MKTPQRDCDNESVFEEHALWSLELPINARHVEQLLVSPGVTYFLGREITPKSKSFLGHTSTLTLVLLI